MERKNTHLSNKGGFLLRSETKSPATTSSDFVLQWGNRKRLRCMKVQVKDPTLNYNGSANGQRATARVDRRVVRSDLNSITHSMERSPSIQNAANPPNGGGGGYGYSDLRQRPASPSHIILRNSDSSIGMRDQTNGVKGLASPDGSDRKVAPNVSVNNNSHNPYHHHQHYSSKINNHDSNKLRNENHHIGSGGCGAGSGSLEPLHDGKKSGSSSGGDAAALIWLPKFVISLTNKEKEEDFMAIKGSKLPQRPKKRAKFIQRTLNAVSPGAWLCDLTLERYEVREKKVSKKRPRGLKAMGNNVDSDSE